MKTTTQVISTAGRGDSVRDGSAAPQRIIILGSTGSIGENTLRVVSSLPGRFEIVGLAAETNIDRLFAQAVAYGVSHLAITAPHKTAVTKLDGVRVFRGANACVELINDQTADILVCAVNGVAGLLPVLEAIHRGCRIALATKEVLVAAGELVMDAARQAQVPILPVDSEHNALFQCLHGEPERSVRRLLLTASGGPFAFRPDIDFEKVTPEEALNHPRWRMGRKISIDSATLMNKGLEIMEAHWLFGVSVDRITVLLHRESLVHSLVEFVDGNLLAQLSPPDMRYAIQYALTWPDRLDGGLPPLDLAQAAALHFESPDMQRFPCLQLARVAADRGGTFPAALNAANEVAVQRFLDGDLPFAGIWRIVERVMERHDTIPHPGLDAILETDKWARIEAAATH